MRAILFTVAWALVGCGGNVHTDMQHVHSALRGVCNVCNSICQVVAVDAQSEDASNAPTQP